jgi:hypothetical protein
LTAHDAVNSSPTAPTVPLIRSLDALPALVTAADPYPWRP